MPPAPPPPPSAEPDAPLAARAAAGDQAAFADLVRRHQRPLFGYLGRMGLSQAEAEEIAQDTFVRAWQALPRFDVGRAAFSTWLYTIARRLALNLLDSGARRRETSRDAADLESDDGTAVGIDVDAEGPPGALARRQQRAWLQAGLHALPLADRSVLALAYVHDLGLAELAAVEGLSQAAAKARLHRARQRLRDILNATGAAHDR